ncbi:unnamed protein product [Phytophthora fragariaefolia]|uniref:Unnamed protein product n=1 Tax=Phytophthora fragariaefolia TaxID=1490495 RepID=A0A9W7D727_9STRA|nr:unnamed protein product [Phytophthora fragariaefolia]
MVRILFDMARYYEPSIIFMDEIDAIASARGAATEHEASRSRVMLLAATNLPWELDEAMRRRLTKRVYIPLPQPEARRALFELNMGKIDVGSDVKLDELVDETEVRVSIYLTKDWNERRWTLVGMRDEKLRRGYEFVMSSARLTDSDATRFSENRFENDQGDLCCTSFDTIQFPGVGSLQQVFDASSFFMANMEIIISEQLDLVMLRDDYDTIEDEAFHSRFVSTDKRGIIVEGNTISFQHMLNKHNSGYGSEPCRACIIDCVDEDELYPYLSCERVRRDSSGAIVMTASRKQMDDHGDSQKDTTHCKEGLVVTMLHATFLKIRRPAFPLSEFALEELYGGMMQ